MSALRLALAGAGFMARRRTRAFLATGRVEVCGVAAARRGSAERLVAELGLGCPPCDGVEGLLATAPEALLVEVPHAVQDAFVFAALDAGKHVLVGGPLAASAAAGRRIAAAAADRGLVVEAGFEARYKASWEGPRRRLLDGEIGRPVAVRGVALWDGRPQSWYYRQEESGGMPLTHMTYCFVNPLRWLFGEPARVAAFANRKKHTAAGLVDEETCVASLLFADDVLGSLVAGFVQPGGSDVWSLTVVGTTGAIEIEPSELDGGRYRLYRGGALADEVDCTGARDAFEVQAEAFLDTVGGADRCRNRPGDALGDLVVAEAIAEAARRQRVVDVAPT